MPDRLLFGLAAFLLLVIAPSFPASAVPAPDCTPRVVPDVGLACARDGGLFEVFAPDGASLGFTHGPDPIPPPDSPSLVDAARDPICVQGGRNDYYVHAIYAHPINKFSHYANKVEAIRDLVRTSNGLVHEAGVATGKPADIRVLCQGSVITVSEAHLPTLAKDARFDTIVSDLRAQGYRLAKVKYWVFYDDPSACVCGGQGHVYGDDSLSVNNLNNGNSRSPTFAINYGYLSSTRIWLHELGHNLGAVQNSAPRATGGYHCIDGHDIMCYNDGAAKGGQYSTTRCAVSVWDCGKDDYFNADPPPGSYLATRWNVGAGFNRYVRVNLDVAPPSLALSAPTPSTVYAGCTATHAVPVQVDPVFVGVGCVVATASDASGIARVGAFIQGKPLGYVTEPVPGTNEYRIEFPLDPVPEPQGRLVVEAKDGAGNTAYVERAVHAV